MHTENKLNKILKNVYLLYTINKSNKKKNTHTQKGVFMPKFAHRHLLIDPLPLFY